MKGQQIKEQYFSSQQICHWILYTVVTNGMKIATTSTQKTLDKISGSVTCLCGGILPC